MLMRLSDGGEHTSRAAATEMRAADSRRGRLSNDWLNFCPFLVTVASDGTATGQACVERDVAKRQREQWEAGRPQLPAEVNSRVDNRVIGLR
ncbi:hypothetical protein E4U17_001316 [Claviceps sp. LM77 group G4]|nr:hypothetical protein E4U17_001316 [Claviceps sp. LM77 group G4]KAG6073923.1 hypothetical protein E4U16_004326 [Claviceps sp. LM84 group G4]